MVWCVPSRPVIAALAASLAASCSSLESGPPPAGDRFERCGDPAATAARERANTLIADGELRAAQPFLSHVVELCPDDVQAHLLRLEVARSLGAAAIAELGREYEAATDRSSPIPPFMRAQIAEYEATRQELLQESLRRDPSFYFAYLELGRQQRRFDRPQQALGFLRDALRARPQCVQARLELGEVLVELGRYNEAELEYDNYRRARPDDRAAAKAHLRLLIYDLDRSAAARPIVEQLLREDPDDLDAIMDLAAIEWKQARPQLASSLYHRVLQADPFQANAVLNLGNLHFEVLAAGDEDVKRAAWARARNAYRYYLNMRRAESLYDLWDYYLTLPYRLKEIDAFLGPAPAGTIEVDDF